jgi:regulator of protease activity HflC (stomatin/prohibitin superfamily)
MTLINVLSFFILLYGVIAFVLTFIEFPPKGDSYGRVKEGTPNRKFILPFYKMAIICGILGLFVTSVIVKVEGQDAGVMVTPSGVSDGELHTGWHIVMPWNTVHMMDKTVWVYTCAHSAKEGNKPDADAIWAPTKDGIKMGFDVSVSWRIIPDEASWIYANISENDGGNSGRYLWLEENVIRPKLKSAMALTVSEYTPIEAYSTKRQQIQDQIISKMRQEVKGYKLLIDQVDMREVFYNPQYETAINAKKLAEQEVLRLVEVTKQKEEELKQASINKDISIQEAEGEAKALQIKGTSIAQNPKIIELEWINKWSGELPTYMMGNGQGVMMNLNNK